ncbi:MAG: hypothetical protein H7227_05840 [Actinobacteria bacterium]|nr:hypothetical protein [Actinomycetota bacterium]
MRVRRLFFFVALVLITGVVSNLLMTDASTTRYSESYPAAVCPPTEANVISKVSVPSKKTLFRKVTGKSTNFVPIKSTRYLITKYPILLNYTGVTSFVWQSNSGVWAGSTLCAAPSTDQWFVGGTADVIGRGRLFLVNSGLSEALVDVSVWNEGGLKSGKVIAVSANSSMRISLDSIAAGSSRLALRVTSRSGRVNAFLLDERGKGLQSLGADFVNPVDAPSTNIVISGIPHQIRKGKAGAHVLRVLTPSAAGANIRVDVISKDGVFAPIGLDGRDVPGGSVLDFNLNPTMPAGSFSIRIRSNEPIVAGVLSSIVVASHRDLVWNSATPSLVPMKLAIRGLNPKFIFTGDSISLTVVVHFRNGASRRYKLTGNDIKAWNVPEQATSVTFSDIRGKIATSALIKSISGIASVPIAPGSTLARAPIPSSDIGVIGH